MDFIKSWIITMLIIAFIVNIIDMLLPSGNLKSHVNLVLNFIFLFVVITPVVDLIKKDMKVEDVLLSQYNEFEYKYAQKMNSMENSINNEQIKRNYEDALKDNLNLKLKEYGYKIEDIDIANNNIKNLRITKEKNSNNEVDSKIKLNEESNYKETFNNEDGTREDEMKNEISKIFKVSLEKIQIN